MIKYNSIINLIIIMVCTIVIISCKPDDPTPQIPACNKTQDLSKLGYFQLSTGSYTEIVEPGHQANPDTFQDYSRFTISSRTITFLSNTYISIVSEGLDGNDNLEIDSSSYYIRKSGNDIYSLSFLFGDTSLALVLKEDALVGTTWSNIQHHPYPVNQRIEVLKCTQLNISKNFNQINFTNVMEVESKLYRDSNLNGIVDTSDTLIETRYNYFAKGVGYIGSERVGGSSEGIRCFFAN